MSKATAREVIALSTIKLQVDHSIRASNGGDQRKSETVSVLVGTETADAILTDLRSAGLVVVPAVPSERMMQAAYDAPMNRWDHELNDADRHYLRSLYLAMIAASQSPQGDQEDKG